MDPKPAERTASPLMMYAGATAMRMQNVARRAAKVTVISPDRVPPEAMYSPGSSGTMNRGPMTEAATEW
ncbi:MAG: hypothetical protein L6R41_007443 [Letrouitia leprolyta]|nr:MAG: hypothetical protein L6R41_007443 [Letrouitia leprolyta]